MNRKNTKYLELVRELALTDFKLKYQGSVLGYLWSLVKPLMLFLILYLVFTRVFKLGGSIPHYPVYLLLGVVIWGFFSEITSSSLDVIVGNSSMIRKVYFPRIILVLSRGITSLMTFVLNFIVVIGFILVMGIGISWHIVFLPFLFMELFILAVGVSLFLSSLYVRFRDLSHIWEVVMQAAFYATPILYPLSLVPQKIANIMMLNPMAQIIQDARYILVTDQSATAWNTLVWKYVWIPYALPFIILIFGYWFFQKSAAKFAEEV